MKKFQVLTKRAANEIKTDEDLIVLTIISSLLAGYAVLNDNFFLEVGSMLVAPFFDPIISLVVLLFSKSWKKVFKALSSLIMILLTAVTASLILFYIYSFFQELSFDYQYFDSVTYFNTFIVSILLGIVGTLLWIWPKTSNTSAGISIAISLVPPIARISAGLATWDIDMVTISAKLLILSLIGIIIGSFILLSFKYNKILIKSK